MRSNEQVGLNQEYAQSNTDLSREEMGSVSVYRWPPSGEEVVTTVKGLLLHDQTLSSIVVS